MWSRFADVVRRNPFWEIVKGAVTPYPSAAQIKCQDPKPILLNTVRARASLSPDWIAESAGGRAGLRAYSV